MACGSHQVPLTAGSIRVVGPREARTVDFPTLTYVGASTCGCGDTGTTPVTSTWPEGGCAPTNPQSRLPMEYFALKPRCVTLVSVRKRSSMEAPVER